MINKLKSIAYYFTMEALDQRTQDNRREYIESYLSQSVDRYDLERRERDLERKGYFR